MVGHVSADLAATLRAAAPEPTRPPSAAQQVASVLRRQIVDGHLRPGTHLVEETVGTTLGFARNTVREAFALLAVERLIVREAHRGVLVATPTTADIADLYALRRIIEPAAVEHGPESAQAAAAELTAIVAAGTAANAAGDRDGVAQANQAFHRRLTAMSGSRRVGEVMEAALAEMRLVFNAMDADRTFHADFLERNRVIADLLAAEDRTGAAAELRAYLDAARDRLLSGGEA